MKLNRKSTRIAYWILRVLAICSALLLFSISGIVALQTATHATALDTPTTIIDTTSLPTDTPTPTLTTPATDTPTPTPSPTPTPTEPPTQVPTPTPTKSSVPPTATATRPVSSSTPLASATPTSAANGITGGPNPTPKGDPTAGPTPTPSSSPTLNPSGTPLPTSTSGTTGSQGRPDKNAGMMAWLAWPLAGVGSVVLLSSAGLFVVIFRKKRRTGLSGASLFPTSPTQIPGMGINPQAFAFNNSSMQPTEATFAQNRNLSPLAMQSIVQYSPLLGEPDSSHFDAPVAPPASDFRPLTLDFPQILEVHTDKVPTQISSRFLSPTTGDILPEFQLASAQFSPALSFVQTPLPPPEQMSSLPYKFPEHDPVLETLKRQAQMGIFTLPDKNS